MSTNQHIISKFLLELETDVQHETYSLQRQCSDIVQQKLAPAMDEIFTRYFPANVITRIHRIEIDLGNISSKELEQVFVQEYLKKLEERIKEYSSTAQEKTNNEEPITAEQEYIESFFYFLHMGFLPWYALTAEHKQWEQNLLTAIIQSKEFFINNFQQLIINHSVCIERFVSQFQVSFILSVLQIINADSEDIIKSILRQFESKIQPQYFNEKRKTFLAALIKQSLSVPINKHKEILSAFFNKLQLLPANEFNNFSSSPQWEHLIATLTEDDFRDDKNFFENKKYRQEAISHDGALISEQQKTETFTEEKNDEIFIDNAGLIILHPFLESLFEELGLCENKSFINNASRQTAVHLLQYLANKQEEAPEYLMPLNKLLCGVAAEEHINRFIQLTDVQKEEAHKLLQTIVVHWEVLKNTSVEGLQQTFLQRRGKLSFNKADGYWKLQVERKSLDILLDKLPWGYSFIQLPWMKFRLISEW